jgi:hypothetical protein
MAAKPMSIGYMFATNVRATWAAEVSDGAAMERALEEAATIRQLFRGRPQALSESLDAYVWAAVLFRSLNQRDRHAEAVARADQLAQALAAEFPDNVECLLARCGWGIYQAAERGAPLRLPAELSRVRRATGDHSLRFYEALAHYRAGRDRDALAVLEGVRNVQGVDWLRMAILFGLDSQRSQLDAELDAWGRDQSQHDGWCQYHARLALGQAAQGYRELRAALEGGYALAPLPGGKQAAFEAFFRSDAPDRESRLLRDVGGFRRSEMTATLHIALNHLGTGNRDEARRWLLKAAEYRIVNSSRWQVCVAFLERMAADPAWPPWARPQAK